MRGRQRREPRRLVGVHALTVTSHRTPCASVPHERLSFGRPRIACPRLRPSPITHHPCQHQRAQKLGGWEAPSFASLWCQSFETDF
jgi:hypothetical protein